MRQSMKNKSEKNIKLNNKANLTLSIDSRLLDEIKEDSDLQGVSINSKVNAILTKYMSFYKISEELECSIIPSKLWSSMLDLMDGAKLLNILNNECVDVTYSMFLNNNVQTTLDSFIKNYCQEIGLWCGMYSSFRKFNEKDQVTLVFEHRFGSKWSKILGEVLINIIRTMLNYSAEVQILPNIVRIIVQEK